MRAVRTRWPGVRLEVRADAGFAVPALYTYLEAEQSTYTIGLATNARLTLLAAEAAAQRLQTGEKARLFTEAAYQAGTWEQPRRVVIKAEALEKGMNIRFVVTTRADNPAALYQWYTQRGNRPELCIKDLKVDCFADRLSDHRFWPNQFRLLLHAAAYWLLDTIRRWLAQLQVPHRDDQPGPALARLRAGTQHTAPAMSARKRQPNRDFLAMATLEVW